MIIKIIGLFYFHVRIYSDFYANRLYAEKTNIYVTLHDIIYYIQYKYNTTENTLNTTLSLCNYYLLSLTSITA